MHNAAHYCHHVTRACYMRLLAGAVYSVVLFSVRYSRVRDGRHESCCSIALRKTLANPWSKATGLRDQQQPQTIRILQLDQQGNLKNFGHHVRGASDRGAVTA